MVDLERGALTDGDRALSAAIERIRRYSPHGSYATLDEANAAAVQAMIDSEPWLVDAVLARDVIPPVRWLEADPARRPA
jgi:hypothetical protein